MRFLRAMFFAEKKLNAPSDGELRALQDATHTHEGNARARPGRLSVTDGPFTETYEQIGGFVITG